MTFLHTSRLHSFVGIEYKKTRIRRYRLMCEDICFKSFFTAKGAKEGLRSFDLDMAAYEAEITEIHGKSAFSDPLPCS